MVQHVAFSQQVNKDKSNERKQSLLLSYALLKPPISWANSLQTEQRDGRMAPLPELDMMIQSGSLRQQESWNWEDTEKVNRQWCDPPSTKHPLQPPQVHRMPTCSGTWMAAVLLLITLTARKHSLVMNSLIHLLLAFPVHPLMDQQQKYFAWKLLISANHLKGAPPLFLHYTLARGNYSGQRTWLPTPMCYRKQLSPHLVSSHWAGPSSFTSALGERWGEDHKAFF